MTRAGAGCVFNILCLGQNDGSHAGPVWGWTNEQIEKKKLSKQSHFPVFSAAHMDALIYIVKLWDSMDKDGVRNRSSRNYGKRYKTFCVYYGRTLTLSMASVEPL